MSGAGGKKGGIQRLRKELSLFMKDPSPHIQVAVLESDMFEWHYLLEGPPDTPYFGGYYYGRLRFPPEYPYKPPGILMTTPSGRFETDRRLCLSMSDYHPETWNPGWSVATVLTGLLSFMTGTDITTGSVETSEEDKKKFAAHSMAWNLKHPIFNKMFPHAAEYARRKAAGLPTEAKSITLLSEDDVADSAGNKDAKAAAHSKDEEANKADSASSAQPEETSAMGASPGGVGAGAGAGAGAASSGGEGAGGDFAVGEHIVMCGLSAKNSHYNGVECVVQGLGEKGRVRIMLMDGKELLMKRENLQRIGASVDKEEQQEQAHHAAAAAAAHSPSLEGGAGSGARRNPDTEELVKEIQRLRLEKADMGVKSMHAAIRDGGLGWEVSEKRLRKVMADMSEGKEGHG